MKGVDKNILKKVTALWGMIDVQSLLKYSHLKFSMRPQFPQNYVR